MKSIRQHLSADALRSLSNTAYLLALGFFQRITGVLTTVVIARTLSNTDLGIFFFTQNAAQSALGVSRLGLIQGLQVGIAKGLERDDQIEIQRLISETMTVVLIAIITGCILLVSFSGVISEYLFNQPSLAPYLKIACAVFAGMFITRFAYAGFAGLAMFKTYSRTLGLFSILTFILIVLSTLQKDIETTAYALALGSLVTGIGMLVSLGASLSQHGIKLRARIPGAAIWEVITTGFPFYASGLLLIPVTFVCYGLLTRAHGPETLGELRVILAMLAILQLVPGALSSTLLSLFSQREAKSEGTSFTSATSSMRLLWILGALPTMVLIGVWTYIVVIVFGDDFTDASEYGPIALLGFLPALISTPLSAALLATRNSGSIFVIALLQATTLLILSVLLIEPYGLLGFFVSEAIANILALGLYLHRLSTVSSQNIEHSWLLTIFFSLAGISVNIWLTLFANLPTIVTTTFTVTTTLVVAYASFRWILTQDERTILLQKVGRL